ncbi:hypothetical protein DL768_001865 [Monosporascus sp. mg162]|nr:hypothetical protein DL768_001865 [Monosporascus sp. mg162]
MHCQMSSIVPEDRNLTWSGSHSMPSEGGSSMVISQSPLWTTSATTARMDTGQLSPISTECDASVHERATDAALPPRIHSAASSCADSWSTSYSEDVETGDAEQETQWEHSSDEVLALPKIEPSEDDKFNLNNIKEAPRLGGSESESGVQFQPKAKRPRGRPRKHPVAQPTVTNKVAMGRSKTGCMNCEKNAVVCEGYHEKQIWKSGREKAEEGTRYDSTFGFPYLTRDLEQRMKQTRPLITLRPIFQGVETPEDIVFLDHYMNYVSGVLTVESEHKNAFKDMLLTMAVENGGLMHSILSMASRHIDYDAPYGKKILETHPRVSLASLLERSEFHNTAAIKKLHEDIDRERKNDGNGAGVNLSVRYGQMLCLLIQTVAEGSRSGEHRVHLEAYKHLMAHNPPTDSAFLIFITEFFQYRVFADELIHYPVMHKPRLALEDWVPWLPIEPARLIGIGDGLFHYLCQITTIRNDIRANMAAGIDPPFNYPLIYRTVPIYKALEEWQPHWPPGDSRDRVGLLYKKMVWIYLHRTIHPPSASSPPPPAPLNCSTQRLAPTASQSQSMLQQQPMHTPPTDRPNSGHSTPSRADSPPPIRVPPHHDPGLTVAVDECLDIIGSFKPSDPVQTLLLVPCLIIGCASFAPDQRGRIRVAVRAVRGYTGLRNCELVLEVLEEVWKLMDVGDWARVWDWQGVARSLDLDFSCA